MRHIFELSKRGPVRLQDLPFIYGKAKEAKVPDHAVVEISSASYHLVWNDDPDCYYDIEIPVI